MPEDLVSDEEFRKAVTSNGFPAPTNAQYKSFVSGAPRGNISTRRELSMFLANIIHESGGLRKKREQHPLPAYGKYYGRGYIQLTWEANYRAASQALYHDDRLLRNPDMVADNEDVAWATAFWFWATNVHSRPRVAEGKFGETIQAINGARECHGQNRDQATARFQYYKRVLAVFVPGEVPIESGCYI
ncbi:uncharacterized protein LOC129597311 [Paramacrobiotus metropolitanus]|uniref:uncharacterized protein LOC129597311 n=1 Tax=Paramacrobiotus metropolitanus TaxID=2943436 RepID=UPI002445BE2E|nr:uncharacterized protein LOC129597311 [Paramacrobiotus metropolitanus]